MRPRIILITAALLVAGCGGDGEEEGKRRVVAGFYPLAYAAHQVGGPSVRVDNLTPPGAEPHDLEVSPRDVARVREADVVLLLGRGFQPQLEDAAGDGARVVRLLEGLRGRDPHVWLDPAAYARLVRRIAAALGAPARAEPMVGRLRALDRELRAGLRDCRRRAIVTSHDAFGHLARRYGLRQVSIQGVSPEGEPTPGELDRVVREAREQGARTVFLEPLLSPRAGRAVARETGAPTEVLNPIEGLTEREAAAGEDYFSLMRTNLAALRRGLGCR